MLLINARNEGEGAYEAELFVTIPEEADYVGIERSNKVIPAGDLVGSGGELGIFFAVKCR